MAVVGLFNLDRLPIAWNDEVQNLDPALVWHNTQRFCSPLWPNPGAETHFLSYPPLIEAWHCLWLFAGKSPWIVRLPFLLFHHGAPSLPICLPFHWKFSIFSMGSFVHCTISIR
jgi:hypothetical protein